MTAEKEHDPNHPYARRFVGCGHGVLFKDYCRDCEIVLIKQRYKYASRTIQSCRDELKRLGVELPEEYV